MDKMQNDTKYDIAIAGIQSELNIRDTFQRQWGILFFLKDSNYKTYQVQ
jgi:hypothetical protein